MFPEKKNLLLPDNGVGIGPTMTALPRWPLGGAVGGKRVWSVFEKWPSRWESVDWGESSGGSKHSKQRLKLDVSGRTERINPPLDNAS